MTRLQFAVVTALIQLQGSHAFLHSPSTSNRASSLFQKASMATNDESASDNNVKRIVFIRHGCTYMNEYLGVPGQSFGSPNFSDVFDSTDDLEKHQDAKLSPRGVKQATIMATRLAKAKKKSKLGNPPVASETHEFQPSDLDLIVLSPLTRAIQTFELGLLPSLQQQDADLPKVVALPLASERVYLISDIGRPRSALEKEYDYIDFESEFSLHGKPANLIEEWWFGLDDKRRSTLNAKPTGLRSDTYEEWRPASQNQRYACPGEPGESFEERMRSLHEWLGDRPESMIAVVCHWGVIDWMLDQDFLNCQVKVVPFSDIQPLAMVNDEASN